jgi:hypothetical protein
MTLLPQVDSLTAKLADRDIYRAADLELSSLYRRIAETYHASSLAECEPQEFNFAIAEGDAASRAMVLDECQIISKAPDIEVNDFNRKFLSAFTPILYCDQRYGKVQNKARPLWMAVLEAEEQGATAEIKFSLFCYSERIDAKRFFPIHRIFSDNTDTSYIFSMTDYYASRKREREYKPFYVTVGKPPKFAAEISEIEGVWLDLEFVERIDSLLPSSEILGGPAAVEANIRRVGERLGRPQDHIHLSGQDPLIASALDDPSSGSKPDGIWLRFLHYVIWLRLMGHREGYANWMEYWYFPVPDWSLRNLHGITMALSGNMDRGYFQLVYAHAPSLFAMRATVAYGIRRSLETEVLLRKSEAHYMKRRANGWAATQANITAEILRHPEIARKAVTYSRLQEATFQLFDSYQALRQRATIRATSSATLTDDAESAAMLELIPVSAFLRTVHMHALISSRYFSELVTLIDDDDTLNAVDDLLGTLFRQLEQTELPLDGGAFSPYDEISAKLAYDLLATYQLLGRFEYVNDIPFSFHLNHQQFINFYTAFLEIMENSIKADCANVFAEVIPETIDGESCYWLFITSTNQSTRDFTYNEQCYDFSTLKSCLTADYPAGGLGLRIVAESLKAAESKSEYQIVKFKNRNPGFTKQIGIRQLKYFWSGVRIRRSSQLITQGVMS